MVQANLSLTSRSILLDLNHIGCVVFTNALNLLTLLHPTFCENSNLRIEYRRIFIEICRYFLEMKDSDTALRFIIRALKVYSRDEELYAALARYSPLNVFYLSKNCSHLKTWHIGLRVLFASCWNESMLSRRNRISSISPAQSKWLTFIGCCHGRLHAMLGLPQNSDRGDANSFPGGRESLPKFCSIIAIIDLGVAGL